MNIPTPGSLWCVREIGVRVFTASLHPTRPWRHKILTSGETVVFLAGGIRPSPPPYVSRAVSWIRVIIPDGVEALTAAEEWWDNFHPLAAPPWDKIDESVSVSPGGTAADSEPKTTETTPASRR